MSYKKWKEIVRELARLSGVGEETFMKITTINDFYLLARMRGLI